MESAEKDRDDGTGTSEPDAYGISGCDFSAAVFHAGWIHIWGAFAAVFSSISTMITFMNDAISNYLAALFDHVGLLKKYLEFFDLPEETGIAEEIGWQEKVEVRHISFRYPGTEKNVLEDVSFAIQKGETIAIVGENGAGKSTLVRILSGILKPDQGEILVDGKNLFSADADSRFQKVSGVFQQFIRYQMSLRDNVEI